MLRGTLEKCNTYAMIEMAGDSFKITHIANSFVDIRDTVSMTDAENVFEVSSPEPCVSLPRLPAVIVCTVHAMLISNTACRNGCCRVTM